MRSLLLTTLFLSAILFAEDEPFIIQRRDPVQMLLDSILAHHDQRQDRAADHNKIFSESLATMRLFAQQVQIESYEQHINQPVENTRSNIGTTKLSKNELAICKRPFPGVQTKDGNKVSDERDELTHQHWICEFGRVRIALPFPHSESTVSRGSTKYVMLAGYQPNPAYGSHGSISSDHATGDNSSGFGGFTSLADGDTTTALFNRTPLIIRNNVLRICGRYFHLNAKPTTIFLYDDKTIAKVVVD